ncbi:MAG: hypothetical protein HOM88_02875 [Hellea sp.]|jgi:hypothetical protein|nr:hypothetical protein [Hellea sp.]
MYSFSEHSLIEHVEAHLIENDLVLDNIDDEQLDEIIGMAAKAVGAVAKVGAKGVRRALTNKQGQFRLSTAGRNTARDNKAKRINDRANAIRDRKKTKTAVDKARENLRNARRGK